MTLALLALAVSQGGKPVLDTGDLGGMVFTLSTLPSALREEPDGPRIVVAPDLRNEAIYLRGRVGTAAEFRRLIARATCAEWIATKDGLRLERGPALREKLLAGERATLTADIRATLPKLPSPPPLTEVEVERLKKIRALWDVGESEAEKEANNRRVTAAQMALSPGERNAARFAAALDPDRLAAALVGTSADEPVRFLDGAPRPAFLPLPLDPRPLLAADRAERPLLAEPPRTDPGLALLAKRQASIRANGDLGLVARRNFDSGYTIALDAVTSDGLSAPLGEAYFGISEPRPDEPLWPGEEPQSKRKVETPGNFYPEAVAQGIVKGPFDPLHLLALPYLEAFLKGERRTIVLDLPDAASFLAMTKTDLYRENSAILRTRIVPEIFEGALVAHPRMPLQASADRLPRAELAPWYAARSDGSLSLDAAAAIAARTGYAPAANLFLANLLRATMGGESYEHPLHHDAGRYEFLRLWATLPNAARAALDAGRPLASGDLPPESRAALWRLTLAHERYARLGVAYLDRSGEIPPLELSWKAGRTPMLLAAEGLFVGYTATPAKLGATLFAQLRGEDLETYRGLPDVRTAKFRPGERLARAYAIAFAPRPVPALTGAATEMRFDDAPPVGWKSLPPAYLDALKTAMEREADRRKGTGGTP